MGGTTIEGTQFNLARVVETIAEVLPDGECLVWRDRRLTYGELAERSRRLASYLCDRRSDGPQAS